MSRLDERSRRSPRSFRLHLLDGFELWADAELLSLSISGQRLVAFLAFHGGRLPRPCVQGTLWPDIEESRAGASLRSALWRVRSHCGSLIEVTSTHVRLGPSASVDFWQFAELAHRLLDGSSDCTREDFDDLIRCGDLLPGWYDDWIIVPRERFNQLRLHALEVLCEQLASVGRFGRAVEAGQAAVSGEPLRESAHRALIGAYLTEGNQVDALRQFLGYRRLAREELGVEPSARMMELVRDLCREPGLQGAVNASSQDRTAE